MKGKRLTEDDRVFKAIALSCPVCRGAGFVARAVLICDKQHSVQYVPCPFFRKGWGRQKRKSIEWLRKSYPHP